MVKVNITKRAQGIYELLNGVRNSINEFVDKLSRNEFTDKDLNLIVKHPKLTLYSKKCEAVYVLLTKGKDIWYIVDILTEEEYKEFPKV